MTQLIVIGASWGGLEAVEEILARLPEGFPVPLLVVQHRAEDAQDLLTGLLDRAGPLPVAEAEDKAPLPWEGVLVAPPGYHVLVEPDHVALSTEAQVRFSRPSIDVALVTAAEALGAGVVGVVLTGDNEDGAEGLAAVRRHGGVGIVQDPATAERPRMPEAARRFAEAVLPLDGIAAMLAGLAEQEAPR